MQCSIKATNHGHSSRCKWYKFFARNAVGALPYEYILEKFGPYLNGRYIYDANGRYTSSMYCCCGTQTVNVETTNVAILGCDGTTFEISDYDVVHLYADRNSNINIKCPRNAKCYVDLWRGGRLLDDCIRNDNIIVNFR